MRRVSRGHLSWSIAIGGALALGGCTPKTEPGVGTTQTTSAVVIPSSRVTTPSPLACLPATAAPAQWPAPEVIEERAPETLSRPLVPPDRSRRSEATESPYSGPPLYESNGSNFSDVGMPYPLPSIPAEPLQLPAVPQPPLPTPTPFFETSFGPPTPMSGFPQSSFGPSTQP